MYIKSTIMVRYRIYMCFLQLFWLWPFHSFLCCIIFILVVICFKLAAFGLYLNSPESVAFLLTDLNIISLAYSCDETDQHISLESQAMDTDGSKNKLTDVMACKQGQQGKMDDISADKPESAFVTVSHDKSSFDDTASLKQGKSVKLYHENDVKNIQNMGEKYMDAQKKAEDFMGYLMEQFPKEFRAVSKDITNTDTFMQRLTKAFAVQKS